MLITISYNNSTYSLLVMIIKFFQYTYTNKLYSLSLMTCSSINFKPSERTFSAVDNSRLSSRKTMLFKPLEPFERRPFGEHVDDAEEKLPLLASIAAD